jgi:nucleotide-binding universal stress UspA family protein
MFKKILFATTASPTCDNAAKVAFDLELKWDAKLYVFHVLGIPSRGYSPFVTDVRTGELMEPDADYIEWVKEEMKNTYGTLLEDSENSVIEAAVGVPYREILRKARKEDIDLIIMGAHTRQEDVGATRYRSIVGSTMQKVAKGGYHQPAVHHLLEVVFQYCFRNRFFQGRGLCLQVGLRLSQTSRCQAASFSRLRYQHERGRGGDGASGD